MTGGWNWVYPSCQLHTHVVDLSLYPETTSRGAEWERANRAEDRGACMCLCGKGWGRTQKEVEEVACKESDVNEPAKDEVCLAASFPPPSQRFTTEKQWPGLFHHRQTHLPEEERRYVCSEAWVLLFRAPWGASLRVPSSFCAQEHAVLTCTVE